jgi:hypothetical protein
MSNIEILTVGRIICISVRNNLVRFNNFFFIILRGVAMFLRYRNIKMKYRMTLLALSLIIMISVTTSRLYAGSEEAYEHLYEVMDRYHNKFFVYANYDEGGNHFYPSGYMGDDISSIDIQTNWVSRPYDGTSCIRIAFTGKKDNWAGVYWQEPENNWGSIKNAGYNLTGATGISFYAKGENGGEKVKFFAGGINDKASYPDSFKIPDVVITLEPGWKEYRIDLTSKDLSHVIGGFGLALASTENPDGATFYLDNIAYDKPRLEEPRFLLSFQPINSTADPDRRLTNACFVYDNALALLTFLAKGTFEDLKRARLLADAFIYAQKHDIHIPPENGRLRNAYMSGDLVDHMTGKVRLPGWWDPIQEKWIEEPSQINTHTGDMAWVIIALLSYYKKTGGHKYLTAAETLGEWIERKTRDNRCDGGYKAGVRGPETVEQQIEQKSTEHNIDVYVAFTFLHYITDDSKWKSRSEHAKRFVDAMWNGTNRHLWSGTTDDGCSIDYDLGIHVDVQAWASMAFEDYSSALTGAESNCYTEADEFKGFDFNNDGDGVWFEGNAHMALAYYMNGHLNKYNSYISELRRAQSSAPNANGKGIVSASRDGLTTGFDWKYFSRLHIGTTAWYLLAEQMINPFIPIYPRLSMPWLPLLLFE